MKRKREEEENHGMTKFEQIHDKKSITEYSVKKPKTEQISDLHDSNTMNAESLSLNKNINKENLADKFFQALRNGDLSSIKNLIEQDSDLIHQIYGVIINGYTYTNFTTIHIATFYGHIDVVKYFLDNKLIDVNTKNNKDGLTPLLGAAANGKLEMVELLIKKGADLTAVSNNGHNALHLAAITGHIEIVKLLILSNIDIKNYPGNPNCPSINNVIKIYNDIKKIAQNEIINKFSGSYAEQEDVEFASQLFLEMHKKGKISYNFYTDISNKIDNHPSFSQNTKLRDALSDRLSKAEKEAIDFLKVIEDEIIKENQLFSDKESQLVKYFNKNQDDNNLHEDALISSLIEIFNTKQKELNYLAKKMTIADFISKQSNGE